jgi:hypothetical protein
MLMAPTALWIAAHHRIPALFIVANNQSYGNDEEHQDRVAPLRGRRAENRWFCQRPPDAGPTDGQEGTHAVTVISITSSGAFSDATVTVVRAGLVL